MAGRNDIEINLKTIAKTGDVANLIAYIHKLGKSLREVGTEDAKALRKQLAETIKSVPDIRKATAKQVKALVPNVSKINALGALTGIDKRLAQFGTAQAKYVQQTVKEMRGAISGGDLSDKTIEMLSASLQKFVAQANKLPPAGLKKLAADIQKTISNTQELQDVIAEANDIKFNIKTDGTGSIDELQHKLDVIASAKNLDDGIKELSAALLTLDSSEAEAVAERLERIKKILEGELGSGQVAALKREISGLARDSSKLSAKEIQKVGSSITNVIDGGKNLGAEIKKTGRSISDSFDPITELSDKFGLSIGFAGKAALALASKIKVVGVAIASLPIGWILALVGAMAALIKSTVNYYKDKGEQRQQDKVDALKRSYDSITSDLEAQIKIIDAISAKENARLKTLKDQSDAMHELAEAQAELENASENLGLLTQEEKEEAAIRQEKASSEREYNKGIKDNAHDWDALDEEIRAGDAKAEERSDAMKRLKDLMKMSDSDVLRLNREAANTVRAITESLGLVYDPETFVSQLTELRRSAEAKYAELQGDNEAWATERSGKLSEYDKITARGEALEKQRAAKMKQIEQREFELGRGQEQRKRDFAREIEVSNYDENIEEENYLRDKSDPMKDDYQKLAEAERRAKRFGREEEEARKIRDKLRAEIRTRMESGKTDVPEEMQTALNNATSDFKRARSSRYQEQRNVDQLRRQIRDRKLDESESRRLIEKEDKDAVRNRLYSRANFSQRLAMDRRRLRDAEKDYKDADAAILEDNRGTKRLTPEQRKIVERKRAEARAYITETREAIANAEFQGDERRASFYGSLRRHSNRLTAMGLGGDVANYDKQTASNTKKLVDLNKEWMGKLKGGREGTRIEMAWGA